ncbi:hypothetical protein ACDA63_00165 [Uliginosibacterium sp. sgz301328]|uniref:hypothetical protein n=1 Tax=Uliginosibacterium sp. sgz301328 TaxID=3243764 RepID=UPI00359D7A04
MPFRRSLYSWIAVAFFVAGCATHPEPPADTIRKEMAALRDAIDKAVKDPERAEQARQQSVAMETDLLALEQAVYQSSIELRALNARPDASRADFDAALDKFDGTRANLRQRIVDQHLALVASTTADEWKALFPYESRAMLASVRIPQR